MNEDLAGHRERLRMKYSASGYDALNDYEQLELILTYIIPRKDVKPIAKELLRRYGTLDVITKMPARKLETVEGMGGKSALFFRVLGDTARSLFKEDTRNKDLTTISGTEDLLRFLRSDIGFSKVEKFKVIFLNNSNNLIEEESLSTGTIDKSPVYPREIIERVIHHRAKSVILSHNHPSGRLEPSRADIEITLKLKKVLDILEIRLIDHIIITRDSYYSFLEEGILELGG